MSDSPGIGQAGGMASLHSKLDQLIAAYTLASTPRGTFIPESIFAPAPNTRTEAVAQDLLATAQSIAPKRRLSALGASAAGDAAQGRAGAVSTLSPALSRTLPGSALRPASLVIPGGAPSAAQAAPAKVRFSVTAPDSSAAENVGMASRPVAGQAVSKGTALQAGDAGLQPAPASSSQATAVSASVQGSASATSEAAAAAAIPGSKQATPLPGASVKPRRSIKQFLQRALH